MIDIQQMQTVVAVAKSGSFSRAAEELRVSQSAISQSVKSMEHKLGTMLFQRNGRQVRLTHEGERLYALSVDVISRLDQALDDIRHDTETMSGKIRLGTLTGIGKSWLGPFMVEFLSEYPELKLELKLDYGKDLIRQFENNELDALILPESQLPAQGQKHYLGAENITMVFPKSFNILNASAALSG